MFEMKYPHLFSPLPLGKTYLKNRIIVAPTGVIQSDSVEERARYYEEKARSGAAVVTVGMGYVDTEHGIDLPDTGFKLDNDAVISQLAAVADGISKHGAIPSIELAHAGMNAFGSLANGHEIFAPVEMEIEGGHSGAGVTVHEKEMPAELVELTIQRYVEAALRAKQAGFKMALVHGGHGWFIHQFISPILNTRTDEWGGSFENRMRLPLEICRRIKEACGSDFLIDFRMSVAELGDGYGIETGIEIAKAMDGHVDLIHASCGNHEGGEAFVIMHPSLFLEDGCNRSYAEILKQHVKTPVVAVGAFTDPEQMDQIIAEGKADAIAIARGIIADPQLPNKAYAGRDDEINMCLRCLDCYSTLIDTSHYYCAINPQIGHESDFSHEPPAAKKQKVMVAGGGIAGMQAALTAASRGHDVVLCEKTDRLGGVLLCEDEVPFKTKQARYLKQQARRVQENPNIEVRLNTPATKEVAQEISPDSIIVAIGSKPVTPSSIEGAMESTKVVDPEELYMHPEMAGDKVVVIGGGLTGCEIAIYMAQLGKDVTVLIRRSHPKIFQDNKIHGEAVMAQFNHLGIKMVTDSPIVRITEDGVIAKTDGEDTLYPADTIVPALGRRIEFDEVDELRFKSPEFRIVGDAVNPANIRQAVTQGHYAAVNVGSFGL